MPALSRRPLPTTWTRSCGDKLSDEDILRKVYMIRGITGAIEPIGDAIKLAMSAIARNAVSQKLRGRSLNQEE